MVTLSLLSLIPLAAHAYAVGVSKGQIKNLVTFGDSYTDVVNVWDGGDPWPVYVTRYAKVGLHPYAVSGATCSNKITYRPFRSVFESQIPAYVANAETAKLKPKETVYTLWIGTNDLGANALLTTHGNLPGRDGSSVVDTTACAVNWVQALYDTGARNFVFMNLAPLQLLPAYSNTSYPNRFWNADKNATEWSLLMSEMVAAGNKISSLMLENLAPKLSGAHIALFDSYNLYRDMYEFPSQFLNGTVPFNVTGAIRSCVYPVGGGAENCNIVEDPAVKDSYLWWDELHPSEQANRIVAREISQVITGGKSKWSRWIS